MPFNLFHRKKAETEQEQPVAAPVEEAPPQTEPEAIAATTEENPTVSEESSFPTPEAATQETAAQPKGETSSQEQTESEPETQSPEQPAPPVEQPVELPAAEQPKAGQEQAAKTYLKAMPLKDLQDVVNVKEEVSNGNIIILRITPLAGKSIEDVKKAVNDLFEFAESSGGDIARLGEERVVVCPKTVRIWREKTPVPVGKKEPLPTAA